MTIAVCVSCGSMKFGSFVRCKSCGVTPSSEREIAYSLVLSDHHFDPEKLRQISESMKKGNAHPILPKEQEDLFLYHAREYLSVHGNPGAIDKRGEERNDPLGARTGKTINDDGGLDLGATGHGAIRDDILKLLHASKDPRFAGQAIAVGIDGIVRPMSHGPKLLEEKAADLVEGIKSIDENTVAGPAKPHALPGANMRGEDGPSSANRDNSDLLDESAATFSWNHWPLEHKKALVLSVTTGLVFGFCWGVRVSPEFWDPYSCSFLGILGGRRICSESLWVWFSLIEGPVLGAALGAVIIYVWRLMKAA